MPVIRITTRTNGGEPVVVEHQITEVQQQRIRQLFEEWQERKRIIRQKVFDRHKNKISEKNEVL